MAVSELFGLPDVSMLVLLELNVRVAPVVNGIETVPVELDDSVDVAVLVSLLVDSVPVEYPLLREPDIDSVEDPVVVVLAVFSGIGMRVMPEDPVDVLKVNSPVEVPVPITDSAVVVALAVAIPDVCDAKEAAAFERMLENSEATDFDTWLSVAVATMLASSELSCEAT